MRGPEGAPVQQCTGATRHVLEPLAEAEGQVAGLLHGPLAGGVRGDAAKMHPAAAVLDEHQDVQSLEQHGVHVQEVDRDDPAAWACRNCRQVGSVRRGAGSMPTARRISQTVDGATATPSFVSSPWIRRYPHSGFSCASRTARRVMPGTVGGRPGLRRLLVSYLFAASLRCQPSSVAGVTGKMSVQRLRGRSRASAANHIRSAGSYRTRPTLRRSTAFSCRRTSSSASFARSPRNARTARPSTRRTSK